MSWLAAFSPVWLRAIRPLWFGAIRPRFLGALGLLWLIQILAVPPVPLYSQEISLQILLEAAEGQNSTVQRLELEAETLRNKEVLRQGVDQTSLMLSTGSQGLGFTSYEDPERNTISAGPTAQLTLPGDNKITISLPFEVKPGAMTNSLLQASIEYQKSFDDLVPIPDPQGYQFEQSLTQNQRGIEQARLDTWMEILTQLQNIHSKHNEILQAQGELSSVEQELETARRVNQLPESSLTVQQLVEKQYAAELTISLGELSLQGFVAELQAITGIPGLSIQALLDMSLPPPESLEVPPVPEVHTLTQVRIAREALDLSLLQSQEAAIDWNPRATITAGSGAGVQGGRVAGSVWAGAGIENAGEWDLGLSLSVGSQQIPQATGSSELWKIRLSGAWNSPGKEESQLTNRNSELQNLTNQLKLQDAIRKGQSQLRSLEAQIAAITSELQSWRLQTTVRQQSLSEAQAKHEAGLSGPLNLEQAQRTMEISQNQGRILSIKIMNLTAQIKRTTL